MCKLWYDRTSQNVQINFQKVSSASHDFPTDATWKKIAPRVRSLDFVTTRRSQFLERITLPCNNLQVLKLQIHLESPLWFFLPERLEKLDVVQQKLTTLKIHAYSYYRQNTTFEPWKRAFEAFFRVFPNVIHFEIIHSVDYIISFSFTSSQRAESGLASILALLVMGNWKEALDLMNTLRLVSMSLNFYCFSLKDYIMSMVISF